MNLLNVENNNNLIIIFIVLFFIAKLFEIFIEEIVVHFKVKLLIIISFNHC